MKAKMDASGHNPSVKMELKCILTLRLRFITEGTDVLYRHYHIRLKERIGKDLSLQRSLKRVSRDPGLLARIANALSVQPAPLRIEGRSSESLESSLPKLLLRQAKATEL